MGLIYKFELLVSINLKNKKDVIKTPESLTVIQIRWQFHQELENSNLDKVGIGTRNL